MFEHLNIRPPARVVAHTTSEDGPYCRTLIVYPRVARQTPHAHRFIELVVSLDGRAISIDYGDRVVTAPAQIVGPLSEHAIVQCGPVARLYVAIGMRRIAPLQTLTGIVPGSHRELASAIASLGPHPGAEVSERLTLGWQRDWLPTYDAAPQIDPRIEQSLRRINALSDPKATRTELAEQVGLSPSRFASLFLEEMGMPLRRYIIWRRVLIALEFLKAGEGTTQAAAAAGFSDAPHLCRSYRATFGSPPSLLPVGRLVQHGEGLEFLTHT